LSTPFYDKKMKKTGLTIARRSHTSQKNAAIKQPIFSRECLAKDERRTATRTRVAEEKGLN
jgi:hypothetical protein